MNKPIVKTITSNGDTIHCRLLEFFFRGNILTARYEILDNDSDVDWSDAEAFSGLVKEER